MSWSLLQTSARALFYPNLTATVTLNGVTAGSTILLLVSHGNYDYNGAGVTASDGQGAYTVDSENQGGSAFSVTLLRLNNANAGTHTITVTANNGTSGTHSYGQAIATEWSGFTPAAVDQKSNGYWPNPWQGPVDPGARRVTATHELIIAGATTSAAATGWAIPPPLIAVHPVGQSCAVGGTATFSVAAAGFVSIWKEDAGTNQATVFAYAVVDQGGVADVNFGYVNTAQHISTALATWDVSSGAASGSLSYQWRKNGSNIGGATSSSYTTPTTVAGDNLARFDCLVTDGNGTSQSVAGVLQLTGLAPSGKGLSDDLRGWIVARQGRDLRSGSFGLARVTFDLGGESRTTGQLRAAVFSDWLFGAAGGPVTIALTGVQAAGQVGTVAPSSSSSIAATGVQAAGGVGNAAPGTARAITGNQATGQVGNAAPGTARAITGNQVAGQPGTLAPSSALALTGILATGQVGTVTAAITVSVAISGVQATTALGTITPNTAPAIAGNLATGQVGTLAPSIGVFVAAIGNQATGQVGNVAPGTAPAISGTQATAQVGTVTPGRDKALTGAQANAALGTLAPASLTGLVGVQATTAVGVLSPSGQITVQLTGVAGGSAAGSLAPASTLALSGAQATTAAGLLQAALAITISGNAASGQAGTVILAAAARVAPILVAPGRRWPALAAGRPRWLEAPGRRRYLAAAGRDRRLAIAGRPRTLELNGGAM